MLRKLRAVILQLHRWFGIVAAAWLLVAALTGMVLVFEHELDMALNPKLFTPRGGVERTLDQQTAGVEAAVPGFKVSSIDLADAHTPVTQMYLRAMGAGGSTAWQALVDPDTGELLGLRDLQQPSLSRESATLVLSRLHYSLYLGDRMAWVFGLVALFWLLNHLVAPLLAFPIARKWRTSFKVRSEARGLQLVHDLHRACTLWFFPLTLMLALSSLYLNWGSEFRRVAGALAPIAQEYDQRAPVLAAPQYTPRLSYSAALQVAVQATGVDPAQIDGLSYNPDKGLYRVSLFDARDVDPSVGRRRLYIAAADARVHEDAHIAAGSAADRILAWQFPLHSGSAFGWAGRLLIFATGAAVCLFVVTGWWLWLGKRTRRKRAPR